MNSTQIFNAIEGIAARPGKKDKETLVAALLKDELAKRVLIACYDPFVTYGIAKVPQADTFDDDNHFDESTWLVLERLAKRELTGNAAKEAIKGQLDTLSRRSGDLLTRILTKDMRAGFTEGTINRAEPGTITVFDCMLAHPYKEHKHKLAFPLVCEPKMDGVRVLSFVDLDEQTVRFFSRSGKEFTTFDHLKEPLLNLVDLYRSELMERAGNEADALGLPDGESLDKNWSPERDKQLCEGMDELYVKHRVDDCCQVVIEAEVVSGAFNKTVGDVRRKDGQAADAKLCVFDFLFQCDFDNPGPKDEVGTEGYQARRERLDKLMEGTKVKRADGSFIVPQPCPIVMLPARMVLNEEEVYEYYEQCREKGLEGAMVKVPAALYYRKRHNAWTKLKAEETLDLQIIGAYEGEGKYAGMLGGVVVSHKGIAVNVGGGISDQQRKEWWEAAQNKGNGPYLIGRLIEVQFHEVTPDGSLRHPRFVRFRDDKPLKEAA